MLCARLLGRPHVRQICTHNKKHLEFFGKMDNSWWTDPALEALRNLNKARVPILKNFITPIHGDCRYTGTHEPLKGIKILEVGSGAGILSESLAKLGADVTGLDVVPSSVKMAQDHASLDDTFKDKLKYELVPVEDWSMMHAEEYDVVISSEVIEHVDMQEYFLSKCVACVRPGGSIIMTTMSKNWIGGFFNIFVCENITGVIPKGAHDYNMFVHPNQMQQWLLANKCSVMDVKGFGVNSFTKKCHSLPITWFNFAMHAIKH